MSDRKLRFLLGDKATAPGDISWDDLKFVVDQFRSAILSRYRERGGRSEKAQFSLVAIETGSVVPVLAYDDPLAPAVEDVTQAVMSRDFGALIPDTTSHLYEIERRMSSRNVRWAVSLSSRSPKKDEYVSEKRPLPEAPQFIEGWTVLYGECVRAGGEKPKIRLRLPNNTILSVPCTKNIAQQAATRLYRTIALKGAAKWRPDGMTVVEFRAQEWIPYKGGNVAQALKSLREVAGEPWRGKSVVDQYRALREDE